MALKVYKKNVETQTRRTVKFLSYVILVAGIFMMFWAYYPMVSFEIYARFFLKRFTASPVPDSNVTTSLKFAQSVQAANSYFSNNLRDFTQANVWFPVKNLPSGAEKIDLKEYTLSIPKIYF